MDCRRRVGGLSFEKEGAHIVGILAFAYCISCRDVERTKSHSVLSRDEPMI